MAKLRYLSVCSGIEAASVAWDHLGWEPVAFSEIEPFPAAVLKHRFPHVPNYGDMTKFKEWPLEPGAIDLLVGGTPCQSFSVAGLRKGLSDPRGGLMLTYLEIAQRLRPRWIVWENVPGVLSSGGGRDFGAFLGALGELGYGWAYRVLDAQWVRTQRHPRAVPQRRRRVFVVGCLGDWERSAAVLFERESVQRDSAKGGKAREEIAGTLAARSGECRNNHEHLIGQWWNGGQVAETLNQSKCGGAGVSMMPDKGNFGAVLQPVGYRWQNDRDGLVEDGTAPACRASAGSSGFHEMNHPVVVQQPVPFTKAKRAQSTTDDETWVDGKVNPTLSLFDQGDTRATTVAVAFDWQKGNDVNNPRPSTMNVAVEHSQTIGTTRTPAVAFTPGNLARGAGPSPNAEVAPTQRCSAGRGADDQRTCVAFHPTQDPISSSESSHALGTESKGGCATAAVAFNDTSATLKGGSGERGYPDPSDGNGHGIVGSAMTVRRLTPRECERLQGFPDDWTLIPWRRKPADECPDGPRYKALGNSMAVNCMAWIGQRIDASEGSPE